jgi:hypothetical protein
VLQQANNASQSNGKAGKNGNANRGQQTKSTRPMGTGPTDQSLRESKSKRAAYSPSAEQVPEPHPKEILAVAPAVVVPIEEKAPAATEEGVKKKKGRRKRTPPPPGETKAERRKRKKARRAIKKAEKVKFKAEQRAAKAKAAAVSFIHAELSIITKLMRLYSSREYVMLLRQRLNGN